MSTIDGSSEGSANKGVLDESYAKRRLEKPELAFRLKYRALVAARLAARFARGPIERGLDLGAAEGLTLVELARHLPSVRAFVGVEYSNELVASARDLPEFIRLIPGDVYDLPLDRDEDRFDLVTALATLEHLKDPTAAVAEAAKHLRPGGLFVASCPAPLWDGIAVRAGLLAADQHETDLNLTAMAGVVREAGLEVVFAGRFMWAPVAVLPYARIPVSPSFSWLIDRAIASLRLLNFLFVNQVVVGRRTDSAEDP